MTTATLTGNDLRVRDAVMRQLEGDPRVDASAVGVSAKAGAVTLGGFVDSYSAKLAAERAAKRVHGVRAVANEIQVRLRLERADDDIARDAVRSLELRSVIPEGVQAVVRDGHLTLTGAVAWAFQREAAEKAVRHVRGVRDIINRVEVKPRTSPGDVRHHIVQALHRNADVNARHVHVDVSNGVAVLTGTVSSWTQRHAAEQAAGDTPGIVRVDNRLVVSPAEL